MQLADRLHVKKQAQEIEILSKRVNELEIIFDQSRGKNKAFDYINDRVTESLVYTKQITLELQHKTDFL